jgi:hypothetical protein
MYVCTHVTRFRITIMLHSYARILSCFCQNKVCAICMFKASYMGNACWVLQFEGSVRVHVFCPTRVCSTRACPTRVCPTRVCPTRVCPTQVCPTRVCPTRVCPTRVQYVNKLQRSECGLLRSVRIWMN